MDGSRLSWLIALAFAASIAAQQSDALKIVVLDGEDGVNIIQQRTAVQPVVEVRDRNNLPVAGVVLTFRVAGGAARFANGGAELAMTTDASGKAVVTGMQPLQNGAVNIQVTATYQGQTATTTITQTNFATEADALQAGKSLRSSSNSGSSGTSAAAGGAAGAAVGAAASTGTAGAAGAGAAGGGGLPGAAIGGIVAGAAVGGIVVAKKLGGSDTTAAPDCSAQLAAVDRSRALIPASVSCFQGAVTEAQVDACNTQIRTIAQQYLDTLGTFCTCAGPSNISAAEKQNARDALAALRSVGLNTGTVPICFQ
jgi:hypothetical protein